MASRDYGAIRDTPEIPGSGRAFGDASERAGSIAKDSRNKLKLLKDLGRQVGAKGDSLQLRGKIQTAGEELKRELRRLMDANTSMQENVKTVNQKTVWRRYHSEAEDISRDFQKALKEIDVKLRSSNLTPDNPFGEDSGDENDSLAQPSTRQDQLQVEAERRELQERNEAFQGLLTDMVGMNAIMNQMAVEVHNQGETIGLIEDDVETAAEQVTKGTKNLQKASWLKKSSRKLICIIVSIVVGVVIVVIIVIVLAVCISGNCGNNGKK